MFQIVFFLAALASADSILENGGFEQGMKGWTFLNNSKTSICSLDRKKKKSGKQSLFIQKTKSGQPFDTLRANIPNIKANQKITISGRFMTKDLENAWFKVFFYDKNGKSIEQGMDVKQIRGSKKWEEIKIVNDSPEGSMSAVIFILVTGSGKLWIDDMKVLIDGKDKRAPPKKLDARTKSWLKRNGMKIKTLDFENDFKDLKFLKKLLKDVRIVQLGETHHGDGTTFLAKARLARFLYEEMGFEVLAFESGLYECEAANHLLRQGKIEEGVRGSVFGIWRVTQAAPLYDYMAKNAGKNKPLRLTGFDTRGSGKMADDFIQDLNDFLGLDGEIIKDLEEINLLLNEEPYKPEERKRKRALAALEQLQNIFESNRGQLETTHGKRKCGFYAQCLENYRVRERFEYAKNHKDRQLSLNLRDGQMAKNLKWLAEVYYPDKKIICWAATSHLAHNLFKVSMARDSGLYKSWKNMGAYIHEWYGKKAYTIGFASYEGHIGPFGPKYEISKPREDSLEDIFYRFGEPLLFVNLRTKNPFQKPYYCSPMSYNRTMIGPWPEVVDGIFFIQVMKPSSAINWD